METTFSTLTDALLYAFKSQNTSLLSLDRICQILSSPQLKLGTTPFTEIPRRRISSILSSSDLFIRAGPPRSCMWALRPTSPFYLSDGVLSSCINEVLTQRGPLTIEQIVELGDVRGADATLVTEFLKRSCEYESDSYGTWWFSGAIRPVPWTCDSVISAIQRAFAVLQHDASIEDLARLLCLATLPHGKRISRRKISRELSRHTDLFTRLARARYGLVSAPQKVDVPEHFDTDCWDIPVCETPPQVDLFDPVEFFSIGFGGFD